MEKMLTPKPYPCPFCGCWLSHIGDLWWHTEQGCFLSGLWFDEKDNNIEKWNRRERK